MHMNIEPIAYIRTDFLEKFGINPGLERIRALCNLLGNPQKKLKIIQKTFKKGIDK